MAKKIFISIFFVVLTLSCAKKKEEPKCDYIGPAEHAFDRAGPVDGGYILPNGTAITPVGAQVMLGRYPTNAIEVPQKNILIVVNNGNNIQSLQVVDLTTNQVKQTISKSDLSPATDFYLFLGLAVTSDGSKLYASGGAENQIYEFNIDANGTLSLNRRINAAKFPAGLVLSPDDNTLYAALMLSDSFGIIDLTQPTPILSNIPVGTHSDELPYAYPFWVTLSKDNNKAYISNWGEMTVSVVDLIQKKENKRIKVGKNPEGLVLSPDGGKLYVANSDTDDISVIDTISDTLIGNYSVNFSSDSPFGASPLTLDISKDGRYIFVSSAGTNSVDVVTTEDMKVAGRIPAGWYPSRALISSDNLRLFIINSKGFGSGPNPDGTQADVKNQGVLSIVQLDEVLNNLSYYTEKVISNNNRVSTYYEIPCDNLNSPVPAKPGDETPIKYVVFIFKENKTYDQILGDMPGTEADPSLIIFGEYYTPNAHKLAREFANLDNCYSDAEVSMQGHMWGTASISNDYVERGWFMGESHPPGAGIEPAGFPANDFFFHHLLKNNIKFMVYGESVGTLTELWGAFGKDPVFKGYVDENWPGGVIWSMAPKDEERARYFAERLKEWEAEGDMPRYIMMLLPNDHNYGVKPGKPTPESMVADNDYALGLVVEALSHSKFWKEMAIFVTEDDPQSGSDHIDAHRTVCLVISPYAKRGYISKVHYSVPNIYKTMELLLGLPPMYQYDERAQAMYDVFTNDPDFTPYDSVPRNHPDEITPAYEKLTPELRELADITATMDFSEPDSPKNAELGKVLKRYMELKKKIGLWNSRVN